MRGVGPNPTNVVAEGFVELCTPAVEFDELCPAAVNFPNYSGVGRCSFSPTRLPPQAVYARMSRINGDHQILVNTRIGADVYRIQQITDSTRYYITGLGVQSKITET